jgi:MFS family permease
MAKGVMSVADYGIVAWLPTLLLRDYSATYAEAGAIVGLAVALPGMVGAVVGGSLSDWIARRYGLAARPILILACYAIATIGALAFFFASTSMQLGLAFSIWGLGSVSGYVVGQVAMQENVPSEIRATTVALSISVTALVGIGCGPTLIPILASNADGSIQSAMTVVAVAAAVTASIILGSAVRTARR